MGMAETMLRGTRVLHGSVMILGLIYWGEHKMKREDMNRELQSPRGPTWSSDMNSESQCIPFTVKHSLLLAAETESGDEQCRSPLCNSLADTVVHF